MSTPTLLDRKANWDKSGLKTIFGTDPLSFNTSKKWKTKLPNHMQKYAAPTLGVRVCNLWLSWTRDGVRRSAVCCCRCSWNTGRTRRTRRTGKLASTTQWLPSAMAPSRSSSRSPSQVRPCLGLGSVLERALEDWACHVSQLKSEWRRGYTARRNTSSAHCSSRCILTQWDTQALKSREHYYHKI
jgi:hypothetical protein